MNAYELAQYLEIAFYEDEDIEKAANMLRQQADRIAELEKEVKRYKMAWNMAENTLEAQTKPLSDEEIVKEWSKFYPDVFHTHLIDFVRAIEERHGIK